MLGDRRRVTWLEANQTADDPAPAPDHIATLLELARVLQSPAAVLERVTELDRAAAASRAEAKKAAIERNRLVKAQDELESNRQRHADQIAAAEKEHQEKMKVAESELAAVRKQAADLKRFAEEDRASAQQLKQRMQEKMKLIEAA
jgi:SMC interacting uncharacterized protein involved in chromosome segregation